MRSSKLTAITAGLLAGGLLLAGCGSDDSDEDGGDGGDATTTEGSEDGGDEGGEGEAAEVQMISDADTATCEPASEAAPIPDPEGTGDDKTEINIGVFSGWDENAVVYELLKTALEEQGYTVTNLEAEAGAVYTGVAQGDLDIMQDAWLPGTHGEQYVDMDGQAKLGDSLEDLGCWFDEGFLTIAVNEDSPAQSIADLKDNADAYGSTIVGIEPGAGLTRVTQEDAMPTYGLEDWDLPTSSSGAMLAELEKATKAGDDIAVTLWHPHWAYAAYDIRDLEDPEGAMGEAERLYSLGREGFSEEYPNVAQLLKNLHITNEQLLEIEDIMVVQNNREKNAESVAQWLEENPDFLDKWRNGELG